MSRAGMVTYKKEEILTMYELACPACNSASQYDIQDYLLMCPFCSATFSMDMETGQKDIFGDHYIVANTSNAAQLKSLITEWLKD